MILTTKERESLAKLLIEYYDDNINYWDDFILREAHVNPLAIYFTSESNDCFDYINYADDDSLSRMLLFIWE